VSQTRAKYFAKAKRLFVLGQGWTLTAKVHNRGGLASALNYHGFRLRDRRWEKRGDILYADLIRRTQ
jgi:hypothetical protein